MIIHFFVLCLKSELFIATWGIFQGQDIKDIIQGQKKPITLDLFWITTFLFYPFLKLSHTYITVKFVLRCSLDRRRYLKYSAPDSQQKMTQTETYSHVSFCITFSWKKQIHIYDTTTVGKPLWCGSLLAFCLLYDYSFFLLPLEVFYIFSEWVLQYL